MWLRLRKILAQLEKGILKPRILPKQYCMALDGHPGPPFFSSSHIQAFCHPPAPRHCLLPESSPSSCVRQLFPNSKLLSPPSRLTDSLIRLSNSLSRAPAMHQAGTVLSAKLIAVTKQASWGPHLPCLRNPFFLAQPHCQTPRPWADGPSVCVSPNLMCTWFHEAPSSDAGSGLPSPCILSWACHSLDAHVSHQML